MLTTFIIALREGVEASLIVGIIAAFLAKEGRRDALRSMWTGVGLAAALCVAVGVALRVVGEELPHRAQEGLETVISIVAIGAVTYMIVWMSRHARGLERELQAGASSALASGSTWALVGMAFFAVLREGFETSVFVVAVLQDSGDPAAGGLGVALGLGVAALLGWGLYRGGVRLNLARFFRATAVVLVLVAAGLVASALHTGAEAGWITAGQSTAFDLSWLVAPGSVVGALLTGMLGLRPQPTVIEVAGWLLYAVPMLLYVAVPQRLQPRLGTATAALAAVIAPLLVVVGSLGGSGGPGRTAAASPGAGPAHTVHVAVSAKGCEPAALRVPAGATTFEVSAGESSRVTEFEILDGDRTLAEAENLTAGMRRSLSLTLQPGRYRLACPGGSDTPTGRLEVTGARTTVAVAPELRRGVDAYRAYVERQADDLVAGTLALQTALRSGDVAAARRAYAAARVPWERAEPVAESFGTLDPEMDARVNDVPRGRWTGFHPIERRLWVAGTTRGTRALATKLVADARRLARLVRTVDLEPAQIANGANGLLGEISKSKVTGEEERYSHLDLVDFHANVEGAEAAFAAIRPILHRRDAALAQTIEARFAAVQRALGHHRRGAGFVSYSELSPEDVRRLSQLIDALAEPLSRAPARALGA